MKVQMLIASAAAVTTLALVSVRAGAQALSCDASWPIHLYETVDNTPNAAEAETGPPVQLPELVINGYLIMMENAAGNPSNPKDWSDLVHFYDVEGAECSFAQLISDPDTLNPAIIEQVQHSLTAAIVEDPSGVTHYNPGGVPGRFDYYIHSATNDDAVPEPGSLALIVGGLAAIAVIRLRRRA